MDLLRKQVLFYQAVLLYTARPAAHAMRAVIPVLQFLPLILPAGPESTAGIQKTRTAIFSRGV